MSQHRFSTSQYDVLCGWDRPLQCFFLVIDHHFDLDDDDLDEYDFDDEFVYSNLLDQNINEPLDTFDYFASILIDRFEIEIPHGLIDALDEDKSNNAGNAVRYW